MSVEYSKLWDILKNRNMKKIELQKAAKISGNILSVYAILLNSIFVIFAL